MQKHSSHNFVFVYLPLSNKYISSKAVSSPLVHI